MKMKGGSSYTEIISIIKKPTPKMYLGQDGTRVKYKPSFFVGSYKDFYEIGFCDWVYKCITSNNAQQVLL